MRDTRKWLTWTSSFCKMSFRWELHCAIFLHVSITLCSGSKSVQLQCAFRSGFFCSLWLSPATLQSLSSALSGPYPTDLSGLGDPARSRSCQHSSLGHGNTQAVSAQEGSNSLESSCKISSSPVRVKGELAIQAWNIYFKNACWTK